MSLIYGRVVGPKFELNVIEFIKACDGELPYLAGSKQVAAQSA
jgi:hypothetical protein